MTTVRMLRGELRSRRAVERFVEGDSGREFRVQVLGDDASPTGDRLRPYEAAGRDWYSPYLNLWVHAADIDTLDAARQESGGVLRLESWE